jgi:hypothetical protein
MLPVCSIRVSTHALHPAVGVANQNDWHDIGLIDVLVVASRVVQAKLGGDVFAPAIDIR